MRAVHNRAGANMPGGVATALLEQTGGDGEPAIGLFEVDEAWLPSVVEDLSPHTVLLGNLFRDQLDRYGELEKLADEWSALVAAPRRAHVVRAERRRPAGGRPRAGPRRARRASASPTSASRTARTRWSGSSTPPTRSTAAAAAPRTRTRPHTSATSASTSARTAATRGPSPRWRRARVELRGMAGSRLHAHRSRGRDRASRCASPASTTSTTRPRLPPAASRSGSRWTR